MIKFAITGNIASGKSIAQTFLKEQGYKVLDTDDVSHELLTVNNIDLYKAFREYDVFENGEFSRLKLAQLVFSDLILKKQLESILHPQIAAKIEEFFEQNSSEDKVFVGIPLLFESGMQNLFDKVILVYVEDDIRLKRLMNRNNFTEKQALARINSQIPQDEKLKLADYVINNNGTVEEFKRLILEKLKLE